MKYVFLMYGPETAWTVTERIECMTDALQFCKQLQVQGKFLATAPLEAAASAKTLRNRGAIPHVTTGPYAETTEQLGGFFLVELENHNEAVAAVSRLQSIHKGAAEIRAVQEFDGLPPARPLPDSGPLKPFMLISYDDEAAWKAAGPEAMNQAVAKVVELCNELDAKKRFVMVSPLKSASTAKCVRSRNGRVIVTDGPFAESREVLGGFYVVLAESIDAAVEIAKRHPIGGRGDVEVRPLFDVGQLKKTLGISL